MTNREDSREEKIKKAKEAEKEKSLEVWLPKTELGKLVRGEKIKTLDEIFDKNMPILEPEIVDSLTDLEEILVDVQKTTRVVKAGRKFSFRASIIVGNGDGYIGVGTGKDKERLPAIRKATREAKLSLFRVKRGFGSWEDASTAMHSVPFKVTGKSASVRVTLIPAPRGVGLVAPPNIKNVLRLAGIQNVWIKTYGNTRTRLNSVRATVDALNNTNKMSVSKDLERKIKLEKK